MSYDRSIDIRCDFCGVKGWCESRWPRDTWKMAEKRGWKKVHPGGVGSVQHACSQCAPGAKRGGGA